MLKQLVILSGKGGTGKTSICAAFAHLALVGRRPLKMVLVDADVDAANLELVLETEKQVSEKFAGGAVAQCNDELCTCCGTCVLVCRYEAISTTNNGQISINPFACEGCAACVYQCPTNALSMQEDIVGTSFFSISNFGPLFHAELRPGQENSGKLVTLIKQKARLYAMDHDYPFILVDGPPGIGCPVISAAALSDLALVVTEPSMAGIHDFQRVVRTIMHFQIPIIAVINKFDLFPQGVEEILEICRELSIKVVGRVPFDATITEAMRLGKPVTSYQPSAPSSIAIKKVWQEIETQMDANEDG